MKFARKTNEMELHHPEKLVGEYSRMSRLPDSNSQMRDWMSEPLWRSGLTRWTSNPKIVGSIPTRGGLPNGNLHTFLLLSRPTSLTCCRFHGDWLQWWRRRSSDRCDFPVDHHHACVSRRSLEIDRSVVERFESDRVELGCIARNRSDTVRTDWMPRIVVRRNIYNRQEDVARDRFHLSIVHCRNRWRDILIRSRFERRFDNMNNANRLNITADRAKRSVLGSLKNSSFPRSTTPPDVDERWEWLPTSSRCCCSVTKWNDRKPTTKNKWNRWNGWWHGFTVSAIESVRVRQLHAQAASIYVMAISLTSARLWSLFIERLCRALKELSWSVSAVALLFSRLIKSSCLFVAFKSSDISLNFSVTCFLIDNRSSWSLDKRIVCDCKTTDDRCRSVSMLIRLPISWRVSAIPRRWLRGAQWCWTLDHIQVRDRSRLDWSLEDAENRNRAPLSSIFTNQTGWTRLFRWGKELLS